VQRGGRGHARWHEKGPRRSEGLSRERRCVL